MANTAGMITHPFASAVSLLHNRDIKKQVIDLNQDSEWLSIVEALGGGKIFTPTQDSTEQPVFYTFYDTPLFSLIDTTGATVSGSGTATVTVTLMPSSNGILVKGKLLRLPGDKNALVTSATNDGFVAKSVDGSNLTLTAGMKLAAFSNAQEEGSDGSDPERWDLSSISNRIQLFSNSIRITDIENASGLEVIINGSNKLLALEMIKGIQKHRGEIALAMFLGQVSTTLFSDSAPTLTGTNGRGVQTTRGIDQYITDYGVSDQAASLGTYTLSDMRDLTDQLTARRAPHEYMEVGSQAAVSLKTDFLKGLNSSGVTSAMLSVDGKELDFRVERYNYGGFWFNLRAVNLLSNTSVVNYIGTGASKMAAARSLYYLPTGKVPTIKGKGLSSYIGYRYLPAAKSTSNPNVNTDGICREVMTGGLAPIATDKKQVLDVQWTSAMATDINKPQVFARSLILS